MVILRLMEEITSYPNGIRWSPPPEGLFKLNYDGAVNCNSLKVSAGGVVRDSHGNFVIGFTTTPDSCTIYIAELWASTD